MILPVIGIGQWDLQAFAVQRRWIVAQVLVVNIEVDRVEPEAVDAPVQPEAGDAEQLILHGRAVEIQVRLLLQEVVQVVLPAPRLPLPAATAEDRQPVVGRRAIRLGIGPDIPVGLAVLA